MRQVPAFLCRLDLVKVALIPVLDPHQFLVMPPPELGQKFTWLVPWGGSALQILQNRPTGLGCAGFARRRLTN
jgi:hypothetical protein